MQSHWKDKLYVSGYLFTNNQNVANTEIGIDWDKWQQKTFGC